MERFICIHGHFYQPPRENPWLEEIEIDDSARPYHDWNERINAECYAPNSASRLLDGEGRITTIVSNYARMSFNFGPTLLSWMEKHAPNVYAAIIQADLLSREQHAGHGNALAQVYNHLIMPLANTRDKRTQVAWGIADFKHRFARLPEGMWLAETAVDLETLDILAEQGMAFCILAPHQVKRARKIGGGRWAGVGNGIIDVTRAYRCRLPSGRAITIFFYHGAISRAVAFEGLLNKGEDFVGRLLAGFKDQGEENQLLTIATDGESYGHHHKFGDMALAYALHQIETTGLAKITNYGEYLALNPPQHEVQIIENTSWSCVHGLERWRDDCGCRTGDHPGWSQQWRGPLRKTLDWLRDEITPLFEGKGRELLKDPWAARDAYVEVILDRSAERLQAFLAGHALRDLTPPEITTVLELMEMQRHALLMYTSCGWFFDEISGIETVQVVKYAARVMQLAEKLFGRELERHFRETLSEARSNLPEFENGGKIFVVLVKPAAVDIERVAAHYAVISLGKEYDETADIYCYRVKRNDYAAMQSGEARLAVGRITVASTIILEAADIWFAFLHLGGHSFSGGLAAYGDEDAYRAIKTEMLDSFAKGTIADTLRLMDKQFGPRAYSLLHLFREERRKILQLLSAKMSEEFEHAYRFLYEKYRNLMGFPQEAGMPVQKAFLAAAGFTLDCDIRGAFLADPIDAPRIKGLIGEVKKWNLPLEAMELEFIVRHRGEDLIAQWQKNPSDAALVARFRDMAELLRDIPLEINYWQIQNTYFEMAESIYREYREEAKIGTEAAVKWVESFRRIGDLLFFNMAAL